jgi:hypothetical protein
MSDKELLLEPSDALVSDKMGSCMNQYGNFQSTRS